MTDRYILTKGNRRLEVKIGHDGCIEIAACCLKTDSWEDYLAFKLQATEADACGDMKSARRYLRAALVALFSHVEGIINEIYDTHTITEILSGNTFYARYGNVTREAEKRKQKNIPRLDFQLGKYLRDVIAHPGIEKILRMGRSKTKLTESNLYEFLDIHTIEQIEVKISAWIDSVCAAFDVKRFPGVNELDDFVEELCDICPLATVDLKSKTERSIDPLPLKIKFTDEKPDS